MPVKTSVLPVCTSGFSPSVPQPEGLRHRWAVPQPIRLEYRGAEPWRTAPLCLSPQRVCTLSAGVLQPRTRGRDGSALPSARLVSSKCATVGENTESRRFTLSLMQWGQFIDHDMTHVPVQVLSKQ